MSRLWLAAKKAPPHAGGTGQSDLSHRQIDRLLAAAGHADVTWYKDENGRPVVNAAGLAVSITHTTEWVFCALLETEEPNSEPRLGIDAEVIRPHPHINKLAARYFGPCEKNAVTADPTPRAFFTCFTTKEAYAKYCGDGLARHLTGDDTAAPDFEMTRGVRFLRLEKNGVLLTLCLPAACGDPEIIEI